MLCCSDKSNDGSLQPDEWQLFFKILVGSALQHRSKQEVATVPAAEAPAPAAEAAAEPTRPPPRVPSTQATGADATAPTAAAKPTEKSPTKKSTIGTFLENMAAKTQSATASVKGPCFVCAAPRRAAKAGA